jgi:hypothetical protein
MLKTKAAERLVNQRNLETQKLVLESDFQDEYDMERVVHFNQLLIARLKWKQKDESRLSLISSSAFAPMILSIVAFAKPIIKQGKSKCKV